MNFQIWHGLENGNWESDKNDLDLLLGTTIKVKNSSVDTEGVYKANVVISDTDPMGDIKELAYLLDGDMVIYGTGSNILMTVETMRELGLG